MKISTLLLAATTLAFAACAGTPKKSGACCAKKTEKCCAADKAKACPPNATQCPAKKKSS